MIASRFKAVGSVAGVAAAALACYLVSLQVAAERGQLAKTERRILAARADIRELRTEMDTRARLVQLERWNSEVLGLQAPKASQYAAGEVQLATYVAPRAPTQPQVIAVSLASNPRSAPLSGPVLTSARAAQPRPAPPVPGLRPAPSPVQIATYKAPVRSERAAVQFVASRPTEESMVRRASYVSRGASTSPVASAVRKPALLGDRLLGEIGRAAAAESTKPGR